MVIDEYCYISGRFMLYCVGTANHVVSVIFTVPPISFT